MDRVTFDEAHRTAEATQHVEHRTFRAEEGKALVERLSKPVESVGGSGSKSVLGMLLGRKVQKALYTSVWTVEELNVLQDHMLPCWIMRPISEPGGPRVVFWCNEAARTRFGNPASSEDVQAFWRDQYTPHIAAAARAILTQLHTTIQVEREQVNLDMNVTKMLIQNWPDLPPDLYGRLAEEAVDIMLDGEAQGCYFCCLERELSADQLRAEAVSLFTPIHSYMFTREGQQLYASARAAAKQQKAGIPEATNFSLADLLVSDGQPQPDLAKAAIDSIFDKHAKHHAITLSNIQPDGTTRHTLHEMWPAKDPIDLWASVMLVSSFDITHQKQTELELRTLKESLQRNNIDLHHRVQESATKQAALEADRKNLQAKLNSAMRHLKPLTKLDTTSPVDKAVAMFDDILRGQIPSADNVRDIRHLLIHSRNLRHMPNLEQQLQARSDLSDDVSRSLVTLLQSDSVPVTRTALSLPLGHQDDLSATHRGMISPGARHDEPHGRQLHRMSTSLRTSITPEVERLLQASQNNWTFDIRTLDEETNGHSLSCMCYFLLQQADLLQTMGMPNDDMATCLRVLESGYLDNPYHNRVHAASVLHMTANLVNCPGGMWANNLMDKMLEFAMYIAAVCHDYQHPGVTNDFLIKTLNHLAVCYNDRSCLENHHASAAYKAILDHLKENEQLKDYSSLKDSEAQKFIRRATIDLILATDMKQHFSLVSRLKGAYEAREFAKGVAQDGSQAADFTCTDTELQMLAAQVALKCADLGHLTQPEALHKAWVGSLQKEYHLQGDKEREAGLPISPLMDREKRSGLSSSQVGFFELVGLPLFQCMTTLLPGAQAMLDGATQNYLMWRSSSDMEKQH